MPQRNGYKSHRGRSGVARRVMTGGPSGTNGIMPVRQVVWGVDNRNRLVQVTGTQAAYYGGPIKGGSAPSATGFMVPPSSSYIPYGAFPMLDSVCQPRVNGNPCTPSRNALGGANAYSGYRMNFSLFGPAGGGPLL